MQYLFSSIFHSFLLLIIVIAARGNGSWTQWRNRNQCESHIFYRFFHIMITVIFCRWLPRKRNFCWQSTIPSPPWPRHYRLSTKMSDSTSKSNIPCTWRSSSFWGRNEDDDEFIAGWVARVRGVHGEKRVLWHYSAGKLRIIIYYLRAFHFILNYYLIFYKCIFRCEYFFLMKF